jgi:mannose-6-phosphate isomerase-like protein (cupin superfamily)
MAIMVTDLRGVPLPDITIDVDGPVQRAGKTNDIGQESLMTMPAGTYRLVFSGENVTALEREVTLKASGVTAVEVALKPAPPPKEVIKEIKAPAPEAPPPTVGPAGQPQILSLVDLVEKEYERKLDRRESLVACSGNTRSTLLQINQDQPARLYEDAESLFYVIAGEGFVQINGKESRLQAGGFASVPRATSYVLGRRGRNPLVVLSVLSGEPCEQAR